MGNRLITVFGIPIILPSIVFEIIPPLTSMRVFTRFAYIGFAGWSLLGILWLEGRLRPPSSTAIIGWIWIFIGMIFLLETQWNFPRMIESPSPPPLFTQLSGPVLEVPFTPSNLSGLYLYHQTVHRQPIYVAEFSRLNRYKKRYLSTFPLLRILNEVAVGLAPNPNDTEWLESQGMNDLQRLKPRMIMIQRLSQDDKTLEQIRLELRRILGLIQSPNTVFQFMYDVPTTLTEPAEP